MIPSVRQRLIARGEIPGSNGGIYNPGAILDGGAIHLLCRREIDYRFTSFVFPELVTLDAATLGVRDTRTLIKLDYPVGARIEDFRTLVFAGQHLAVHTTVSAGAIRPGLSRIAQGTIRTFDPFAIPVELKPVEKNWVLFEHAGHLHCLYSLDPLTIARRETDGAWVMVCDQDNGWASEWPGTLSNSANLIPFEGGYLGFWHTIDCGRYLQGAVFLSADLRLRYRTGVLLDGGEVSSGYKPGVLYVSALLAVDDRVLAFYGEGDAHTGVATFDRQQLWQALKQSPFTGARCLRVRFRGDTLSDAFRGMQTLRSLSADRSHPPIRLIAEQPHLVPTLRMLSMPNVSVRRSSHISCDDLTLDGRTGSIR